MDKILMDTYRRDVKGIGVTAYANVPVDGDDVKIDVLAFGWGQEGTDKAFDKLERVLNALGFTGEKVRVY